jgi:Dolichyl-phosphate-mannose-protein mannosyltransferase
VGHGADETRGLPSALTLVVLFVSVFFLHSALLHLPYFWDEAGYYVPAARDLLLTGSLIPHTTPSNAHPPLVMAYLALWWKIGGFSPVVARSAMLLVSAFSLLGVFQLAARIADTKVAIGSVVCTALYPVFFVQSSLAQVDLAAAGFTFWALLAYVEERKVMMALWFSLGALAKETAILAPFALCGLELLRLRWRAAPARQLRNSVNIAKALWLLVPALPLGGWYGYHYLRTGIVFGNPEFLRYNVQATMHPLRVLLALFMRLWQTFGYLHLWSLSGAALLAMLLPPLRDGTEERRRIAFENQFAFLAVAGTYVLFLAFVGGAVLARYMLPVVPLGIIVGVSTLRRRVKMWYAVVGVVALGFVAALVINPPYGFSLEDNLAYVDYIVLHQHAEEFVESRYPMARVLTAWPANDELTRPFLGYVTRPMRVVRIEDFTADEVLSAAELREQFDVAFVFSTKYEPAQPMLRNWRWWRETKARFFGYHRDIPPAASAEILRGEIAYSESRKGQWAAVIELHQVRDARGAFPTAAAINVLSQPPLSDRSGSSRSATPGGLAGVEGRHAPPG